jgi:TetR/AcrR family transcriptional regulator, transcriptional repressor for nem operon
MSPLRKSTRQLTPRGAATHARIVEAAADLIYLHGVEGTSLDDVMAESGASKSQLYHYFADKNALVLEVIALQTERVFEAQQPHLEALDSLPALRRWRDAVIDLQKGKRPRGCPIGTLASELSNDFEGARAALATSFATWSGHIENGLQAMRLRGELAPSADPRALAAAILCAIQGGLLLAKTTRTSRPLELAFDMAIDHVARHMTNNGLPKSVPR